MLQVLLTNVQITYNNVQLRCRGFDPGRGTSFFLLFFFFYSNIFISVEGLRTKFHFVLLVKSTNFFFFFDYSNRFDDDSFVVHGRPQKQIDTISAKI